MKSALFDLSYQLKEILLQNKLTLAVAESCTGGLLGAVITHVAGSSEYFLGGIISYHNAIKSEILGVPGEILERFGAVSAPVVEYMAQGAKQKLSANAALSISGVAGPGGGSSEKPVGLVYIGMAINDHVEHNRSLFTGDREEIREQAVETALQLLIAYVLKER